MIENIIYVNDNHSTVLHEEQDTVYITFPKLDAYKDDMIHGFSTRKGGVSQGYLGAMNLSFTRGDDWENVLENHRRFAQTLGYDEKKLVFSNQVHHTAFHKVTKEDCGKGIVRESDILEIDGLVTNEPGVPMITFYADCVPLFFYDPQHKVIAMAHSGWRGTVEKIGGKMVAYMHEEYGCDPDNIVCAIGPSICQKCYEVSEDVAQHFTDVFGDAYGETLLYRKENGKYQLNLQKACEITLLASGIRKEHLDVTDLCTCCNPDWLFSHRASNGKRGNLAAVMMLKEKN